MTSHEPERIGDIVGAPPPAPRMLRHCDRLWEVAEAMGRAKHNYIAGSPMWLMADRMRQVALRNIAMYRNWR